MEIRQLKAFQTVAVLSSFTRAAAHLNYAQSSISAQIQALEEELQVKLFDRLGKRILLTEAGERLLQYADKILDLEQESRMEVSNAKEPQGTLTIRVPETLGVHHLPPVIKRFQSRFPKIRLRFITCAYENLQKDLRKGITDLAFLFAESVMAADLTAEVLGFESLVLVAHPDHRLARLESVQADDLSGETFLISRVDCSYLKSFQDLLQTENIRPGNLLEFNSVAAIKKCILENIGITLLPEVAVAEEITLGRLAALKWVANEFETAILMIWYKQRWMSPSLNAFIETVRAVLGSARKPHNCYRVNKIR